MSGSASSRRGSIDRRTAGRVAAWGGLVVILGAILGPLALTTPPPLASPGATQVAAQPTPTTGPIPTATLGPTIEPEPWDELAVPAFEPLAALSPNERDRLGVAPGSSFTLRSIGAIPAVELARGLRVDPPLELRIEPGSAADTAVITPAGDLTEGTRYRFQLDAPDGALAGMWAFNTRAPIHIVSTLPGDEQVGVPLDTGIEVEFDQDGTEGLPAHFSIEPPVAGRFEQHDRIWAFVPDRPLAEATIYRVSISPGVGVSGSTETLEQGLTFRFETGLASDEAPRVGFSRSMLETRPGERLALPLNVEWEDEGPAVPESLAVEVHRLAGFSAVVDAAMALAGPDAWAFLAPSAVVDTSGMTLVARVQGTVADSRDGQFLRLPYEPGPGAYIVTIVNPGPPQQLLLQVTNVGAYALTAEQSTVVWVNDLATRNAIAGAAVSLARGAALGTTDAAGVLRIATPAELQESGADERRAPRFIAVRGPDNRRILVPLGLPTAWYHDGWEGGYDDWYGDRANWWLFLKTDRTAYRQTDTINVTGLIKSRADREVPGNLELRLRAAESPTEAAIRRLQVTASARGVFTGSIQVRELPIGSYAVDLVVGGRRVASAGLDVALIRKPAYQIEVTTDRHVYLLRDQVAIAADATFFDGTPVPGMELEVSGFERDARATTDGAGHATAALRTTLRSVPDGWSYEDIGARPVRPEEGQISGSRWVVIVPSRAWLAGSGTVTGGRVVVDGRLTWADIAGMEAKLDAGVSLDGTEGPGRPIGGGTVRAEVVHIVPIRNQQGTSYDFIEKRVVPVWEYDERREALGTYTLTSAADGTFRLSVPAPVSTDRYEVTLRTSDPEGRSFVRTLEASAPIDHQPSAYGPYLVATGSCGYNPATRTGLDEPFSVTMHQGSGAVARGRFLFLVGREGSIETTVQDAATFSRTLLDADLPGFTVRAIWLSDLGYAVASASTVVDPDDKRLTITLTPDKARYRPGGQVSIRVTTTDPAGRPVAADVVVTGVDEKLYAQGLAFDEDPVDTLMASQAAGFLQTYTTHWHPRLIEGGCGATGGGGRDDFRDAVTFQHVTTDANGNGVIEFDASDDLTSWHMTAMGFTSGLDAGTASVLVPVGLPFFVDAVMAPEYLVGDDPVLRVRAFGTGLAAGTPVRFTISAPSLGLAPTTVEGRAFEAIRVPLPGLVAGDHPITISGSATRDGRTLEDALTRPIHVVASRLTGLASSYDSLEPGFEPQGGEGLTTYAITDAGRGRLLGLLQELAWAQSGRFDRLAAAELARRMLVDEFDFTPASLPAAAFDAQSYLRDGIRLLPYGDPELFLSARAALVVPRLVASESLVSALRSWSGDEAGTRERTIVALAGLAGLGEDVLPELQAFDPATVTVREQLWLALGLAAAGDEAAARTIERSVLEAAGQRLGPWVRISAGETLDDTVEASGLLLLLAGRLGDPIAHEVSQYLVDVRSDERVFPLEQVGYVLGMLERLPREPGRFAWTVDGERQEVQLERGRGFTLVLTADQRATFTLERLEGELGVVTTWVSSDVPLPTSSTITVSRTVTPVDGATDSQLVRVRITVTFGAQSAPGCYRLVDLTPSGLAAISWPWDWDDDARPRNEHWPHAVDGQRVSWCAGPRDDGHVYAYVARVVSPGTYRWEPAVVQFELSPGLGAATPETTYTIR